MGGEVREDMKSVALHDQLAAIQQKLDAGEKPSKIKTDVEIPDIGHASQTADERGHPEPGI